MERLGDEEDGEDGGDGEDGEDGGDYVGAHFHDYLLGYTRDVTRARPDLTNDK